MPKAKATTTPADAHPENCKDCAGCPGCAKAREGKKGLLSDWLDQQESPMPACIKGAPPKDPSNPKVPAPLPEAPRARWSPRCHVGT
jgi:hypothetical protein